MSKYKEIKTQIKRREFICQALEELGMPFEVAQAGGRLSLYGYEGRRRPESADVVVRREHVGVAANDLGWAWDGATGTYVEIISEFDSATRGRQIANQVRQKCALYRLQELAWANGYMTNVVEEAGVQRVKIAASI